MKKKGRTTVKTNKTKSCFFEEINKIDKQLGKCIKKKMGESNQQYQEGERRGYNRNTEIQMIIRSYYEQLCTNKMDNPKEMDIFLEKLNLQD